MAYKMRLLGILLGCVLLIISAGCQREIEKVSDDDLRAKYSECYDMNEPGAAMIMACKNYKEECDRRSKEIGRFIC